MPVHIGAGLQSFSWLAGVVCRAYGRQQRLSRHLTDCTAALCLHSALSVVDADDNGFLPSQPLYAHVTQGQHLFFTLSSPLSPPSPVTSPPTLYSLLSSSAPQQYRAVLLHFDLSSLPSFKQPSSSREVEPPYIASNFHSSFRSAVAMRLHKGSQYRTLLSLPLGCRLFFVFIVRGEVVLADEYDTVRDQYGNRLHYLEVRAAVPNYVELKPGVAAEQGRVFPLPPLLSERPLDPRRRKGERRAFAERVEGGCFSNSLLVTEEEEDDQSRVFPVSLTGHLMPALPALVASLAVLPASTASQYSKTDGGAAAAAGSAASTAAPAAALVFTQSPLQLRVLDTEWELMRVSDVVDSAEKATLMRETLTRHHLMLRAVMAGYQCQCLQPPWAEGMTRLEWLSFCRVCRLQDRRCSVHRLSRIFSIALLDSRHGAAQQTAAAASAAFSEQTSLFSSASVLPASGFLSALIRLSALKFKQLSASSPQAAFESLLQRHVLPFASLYHLPSSHLRGDAHRRQMSSLSSQSTQEREREKERGKEKLLLAALLQPAVMQELSRREEELYALWQDMQRQQDAATAAMPAQPADDAAMAALHPLWSQSLGAEALQRALSGRRWWGGAADSELLLDCWVDESMDEKQSEKEKEIEREKAAEREKEAGGGSVAQATAAGGGLRDSAAVCSYRMAYAEWVTFMVKLSDRWHIDRERRRHTQQQQQALQQQQQDDGRDSRATAAARPGSASAGAAGGEEGREESKEQLSAGGAEDEERRREDEEAALRLRQREAADDQLHHRKLPARFAAFMRLLFPSQAERERLRGEEERERAEAAARDAALRADREKAEKAERAANLKKKQEAEGKSGKQAEGKAAEQKGRKK